MNRVMTTGMVVALAVFTVGCAVSSSDVEARRGRNRAEVALWQVREQSFAHELHEGMELQEVLATRGKADGGHQSIIGGDHIGTLVYRRYVDDAGVRYRTALETYHLTFVHGRLSQYSQSR